MRQSISGFTRLTLLLLLVSAIGLAGCDTTGVQPEAPDPDEPMTEAEFKARMAQDGVVVLQPKDFEAYGITDAEGAKATNCTTKGSPFSYTYSVCTASTTQVVYNIDYFRVTIDASIQQNFLCPIEEPDPTPIPGPIPEPIPAPLSSSADGSASKSSLCPAPDVSVTSTTVRDDGVILQANDNDTGSLNAEVNFVALYPQADDFEFHHVSTFDPVNDSISATVAP